MEIKGFVEMVKVDVKKKLGKDYEVTVCTADKDNGVVYTGLFVQKKGEMGGAPPIYLDEYFEGYKKGDATLMEVVDHVARNSRMQQSVDVRRFMDYGNAKKTIVYRLVNGGMDSGLLDDIPHIDFFDMVIIFHCLVSQDENSSSSILIHNVHLRLWDITVEKLYQQARENTQQLEPYELKTMQEVICEIMEQEDPEGSDHHGCMEGYKDDLPMYVLSNKTRVGGATCMLYPNLVRDIAGAIGSDLYIIPSSIHEILILPTEHDGESAGIKSMIKEINDTQVSPEEVLSYSLYYYDRDEGKIIKL